MTPETRSLLRAAAVGDSELVKSLIAEGTDVNCVSAAGQTPLMLAAAFGHEGIVRVLLESGAFIGATDELGLTANEWAANFPKIAELIFGPNSTGRVDEDTGTADHSNGHQKIIARLSAQRMREASRQRFEQSDSRVTLGGLAGAILRERVAKTANSVEEYHEQSVDALPPPAPPPWALVDDSNDVEPVVDSLIDLEEPLERARHRNEPLIGYPIAPEDSLAATSDPIVDYPFESEEPVEATPSRTDPVVDYPFESEEPVVSSPVRTDALVDDQREWEEPAASTSDPSEPLVEYQLESEDPTPSSSRRATPIIDYPEDYEVRVDEFAESGDDTLSRAGVRSSDDTSPAVPNTRQRQESFQSLGLSEAPPARISKVQVDVSPKGRQGSTRTLIWILVILFLFGGAYAGYRLSSYFLNSTNPPEATVTPKAEPQPQPTLGPVKAAPVVGGELAGTELFVPDAEYPTAAAPQSGTVIVHVRVNQRGIVLSADATEGDDKFTGAAEQAGKEAAFTPEKLRGKGQVIGGTITYTFIPPTTTSGTTESATSTAAPEPEAETPRVGGPLAGTDVRVSQPDYPEAAKRKNIAGTVTIVVRVSRAGRVVSWRTLDGDNLLRPAALKAAKEATFDPAKLPGSGDVVGTITFTFGNQ